MARGRRDSAVERALAELYGADPGEFVATRRRLQDELGPEVGKQLAGQRKPTVAAWAVNQLVRQRREDVGELVGAGARLRKLQEGLLAGQAPKGVDEAIREVRERIPKLTQTALEVVRKAGHPASEATSERIFDTLLAAVADEERSDELQRGRLTKEWQPAGFGFTSEAAAGAATSPGEKRRRESKARGDDARRKAAREQVRQARDAVAAAREDLAAKEAESRRLEREVQEAAKEADRARARLDRAEGALKRAREDAG